jgi:hypothetical protein
MMLYIIMLFKFLNGTLVCVPLDEKKNIYYPKNKSFPFQNNTELFNLKSIIRI